MLVKSSARLRYLSIPPRKMRLVAETVQGMPVEKALGILNFTPRIAARHLAKTVKSAAANALSKEGTDHLSPETLVIKKIIVDAAPMAKRIRFRSMGRVYRFRKRYCHLTVELEGKMDVPADKKAREVAAKPAAKKTAKKTTGTKAGKAKGGAKKKSATKPKAKKTVKKPAAKKTTAKKKATGRKKAGAGKKAEK